VEARGERPDAEEDPEGKIERRAAEREDDRSEERPEERAGRADEAQSEGGCGDRDVDPERDEPAAERARLENVRPSCACPEQTRENRGSHERRQDVVVQLGRKALDGCARERGREEAQELRRGGKPRSDESIEQRRAEKAEDDIGERARERLSRVPPKPRSAERHSDQGGEAVAKSEVSPSGSGDREISAKENEQEKNDQRVQGDPDRKPSLPLFPSQKIRRHPRQHENIEKTGDPRREGSLNPRERRQ
jgi:hypothetical protein